MGTDGKVLRWVVFIAILGHPNWLRLPSVADVQDQSNKPFMVEATLSFDKYLHFLQAPVTRNLLKGRKRRVVGDYVEWVEQRLGA
jgi:hypothetical protein